MHPSQLTTRKLSEDFLDKLEVFQSSQESQSQCLNDKRCKPRKPTISTNYWQEHNPQNSQGQRVKNQEVKDNSQQKPKLISSARKIQEILNPLQPVVGKTPKLTP